MCVSVYCSFLLLRHESADACELLASAEGHMFLFLHVYMFISLFCYLDVRGLMHVSCLQAQRGSCIWRAV